MFKKLIFPTFILWVFSFWLTHADFKEDDNGRKIAELYLESNKNDDFWKDNSPRLWEYTPLYMEKNVPSYVEYQVVCEKNTNCGYIIVNVDGDDVQVPTSSNADIPPTQILISKSWEKKENLQFYYFSPFDIYSKNILTGQFNAIDPQTDPMEEKIPLDVEWIERNKVLLYIHQQRKNIYWLFQQQQEKIIEYKKTQGFQNFKQTLTQYNIFDVDISPQMNNMKYIPWTSTYNCNSIVPCYEQYWFYPPYADYICAAWCSPVAAAIVFEYHDIHNFPQLLPNFTAPMISNGYTPYQVKNMISELRWHMSTVCNDDWEWATNFWNIQYGSLFAQYHGYPSTNHGNIYAWQGMWNIFSKIQTEIDNGRPVVVSVSGNGKKQWHSVVAYGYSLHHHVLWYRIIMNAGWWNGNHSNTIINLSSFSFSSPYAPGEPSSTFYSLTGITYYHIQ